MSFNPNRELKVLVKEPGQFTKNGIFVQKGTIISASIHYDARVMESWSPSSVILKVKMKIGGLKFDKDASFFGDYKVSNGNITDEGSTFRVWDILKNLARKHNIDAQYNDEGKLVVDGVVIDGEVPFLIGKELWTLSFLGYKKEDGTPGYRTFNQAFVQREDQDDKDIEVFIRNTFYRQVDTGWEKSYNPLLAKEGEWPKALASYGRERALEGGDFTAPTKSAVGDTFTADDDMPF